MGNTTFQSAAFRRRVAAFGVNLDGKALEGHGAFAHLALPTLYPSFVFSTVKVSVFGRRAPPSLCGRVAATAAVAGTVQAPAAHFDGYASRTIDTASVGTNTRGVLGCHSE